MHYKTKSGPSELYIKNFIILLYNLDEEENIVV